MFSRIEKYGALNSHDLVKVVALVIMTIDHVGAYLLPDDLWWRAVGRITFPVWFFLIGYARTNRIGADLRWGAVILIGANLWAYYPLFPLNALVSIMVCRLLLRLADRFALIEKRPLECFVVLFFANVVLTLFWEYGTLAVMFAFGGRMVRMGLVGWTYALFWVLATLSFVLWQSAAFDFTQTQLAFVTFGTAAVCVALYNYEQADLGVRLPRAIDFTVKLLSRYSLEYYVVHRVLFQMIAAYLLVNHAHVFRLFYE